jgi:hypothetical protein
MEDARLTRSRVLLRGPPHLGTHDMVVIGVLVVQPHRAYPAAY